MAPRPTPDSAVSPCFHGCLAFLHRHFPPQSPPSHPLNPSLHSQQKPSPWDCSTIPKLQLPATAPSRGPASLSKVCIAVARTVWFSFHLGCRRLDVSLSALNVSPLTQTTARRDVGIGPLLQFLHPRRACPVLLTPVFPPGSFILPSPVWFYIFFSTGQVLLSAFSWCSACTSVSEAVFLVYPWREMYFTSTYSSAVLVAHCFLMFSLFWKGLSFWQHSVTQSSFLHKPEELSKIYFTSIYKLFLFY